MELSEHKSNIELLKQQISQKEEMLGIKDNDTSSAKMELSKQQNELKLTREKF